MKNYIKVTGDLFWSQMTWTFSFLGIVLIVNIIRIAFNSTEVDGGFYYSVLIAANIYMLVIGIIAIYFLPYYVENGVTRKDAFLGTFLSSIGVAIAIPIITFLVSLVERFILTNLLNLSYKSDEIDGIMNEVITDLDGNIIGELVVSVILTPSVDPESNWLLALIVFATNILLFYILGWFISTGFYAHGTIIGLLFIAIAFFINIVKDGLLRVSLGLPVAERLQMLTFLSPGLAILGIILLIIISALVIRLLTKKLTVKM